MLKFRKASVHQAVVPLLNLKIGNKVRVSTGRKERGKEKRRASTNQSGKTVYPEGVGGRKGFSKVRRERVDSGSSLTRPNLPDVLGEITVLDERVDGESRSVGLVLSEGRAKPSQSSRCSSRERCRT